MQVIAVAQALMAAALAPSVSGVAPGSRTVADDPEPHQANSHKPFSHLCCVGKRKVSREAAVLQRFPRLLANRDHVGGEAPVWPKVLRGPLSDTHLGQEGFRGGPGGYPRCPIDLFLRGRLHTPTTKQNLTIDTTLRRHNTPRGPHGSHPLLAFRPRAFARDSTIHDRVVEAAAAGAGTNLRGGLRRQCRRLSPCLWGGGCGWEQGSVLVGWRDKTEHKAR
jgi:hypothetical protein